MELATHNPATQSHGTASVDRIIEAMARVVFQLACRCPLRAEVRVAYTEKLIEKFSAWRLDRGALASLVGVHQVVLLSPPPTDALVAGGCFCCRRGDRSAMADPLFVTSYLTDSYEIRTGGAVCARHAAKILAAHFLLTLPDRAADGGQWSAASIRAALRCIIE